MSCDIIIKNLTNTLNIEYTNCRMISNRLSNKKTIVCSLSANLSCRPIWAPESPNYIQFFDCFITHCIKFRLAFNITFQKLSSNSSNQINSSSLTMHNQKREEKRSENEGPLSKKMKLSSSEDLLLSLAPFNKITSKIFQHLSRESDNYFVSTIFIDAIFTRII